MAYSPSHRPAASMSTTNLAPPQTDVRQRRMTSPSLPPPSPLNLPEPVYGHRRPPSPLRKATTIDPETGEISESEDGSVHQSEDSHEGRPWARSHSPSPSVAKFAANIAQRVGSLVNSVSPGSRTNDLPTDDELEAEAERQRERSRREAERIMRQEAEDRRTVEQRVMAMLNGADCESPNSLPLPPSRSQTIPPAATPPSPTSQKDTSWWAAAKNKLTPTKEPLTPAQQVIQETKAREREQEKGKKKREKQRQRSKDSNWPAMPEDKFEDPAFMTLGLAAVSSGLPPPARPISAAPSSPGSFHPPPSLMASPLRSGDGSQSHPIYAQFTPQGSLDVPTTLLTIAKRFEKLEKWTVGHVRALEERMDDVERWLVEKEKEKEQAATKPRENGATGEEDGGMGDVREELAEIQARMGEMGREMAKLITAPGNLASGPSRNSASIARAPSATSAVAIRSISQNITTSPTTTPPRVAGSVSPPVTTATGSSRNSRTRLPYPTGDYATPPDSTVFGQSAFSPPNSPPSSITSATRHRHISISGLPGQDTASASVSPSGILRGESPMSTASPPALSPPRLPAARTNSVSPTPRKRYTVALDRPIMSRENRECREERGRPSTPHQRGQSRELSTAFFSTSPLSTSPKPEVEDSGSDFGANEETVGKSAARRSGMAAKVATDATDDEWRSPSVSPVSTPAKRPRPQTMYGSQFSNIAAPSPVTPLNVRLRSKSTDRFGLGISDSNGVPIPTTPTSKFVDPLLVRRQTKDALTGALPNPPKVMPGKPRAPVGELVAYFDQEKA
ncbi:hypothetical protein DAEQUDRAFT_699258 [Daedalea quercina L-15889]|uniref:Uncharacterized protein n=1 Tax=Daedalea quercina L-15889 TaxID=1314783 RepID=A0A165L972_9APHY|nr:hypothetical protein DAEQUDRAFT_699258 [Daedalea quercina L-15889]